MSGTEICRGIGARDRRCDAPCPHVLTPPPLRICCTAMTRHYVRDVGDIQDIAEKTMGRCGARAQARPRTVMGRGKGRAQARLCAVMGRAVGARSAEAARGHGTRVEGAPSGEAAHGVRERAGHLLRVPGVH